MSRLQLKPNVSIIHSLRSIGYSLDISIADILDNSITASASHIQIHFDIQPEKRDVFFAIVDNGMGMDFEQLQQAITLGSKDPNQMRSSEDLGRFGLGLKTASFSQCKCLTLISKKPDQVFGLQMDLDENEKYQDWGVTQLTLDQIHAFYGFEHLNQHESGTLVVWKKCDRLLDDFENMHLSDESFSERVYEKFSSLNKHLGLVFHRWIKHPNHRNKITISINGVAVDAIDPFARKILATQEHPQETIPFNGAKIAIQAFTLPHHSKCSKQDYEDNSLGDYILTQGFYVYRNDRLLIGGDWFRLHPKQELSKLCRVAIDLPNTLDHQWKIDVKKSIVELPLEIKNYLKEFIGRYVSGSKRVYTHRGSRKKHQYVPLWDRFFDKNQFYYAINSDHPLVYDFVGTLNTQQQTAFKQLIGLIADCLPKDQIFADLGNNPNGYVLQNNAEKLIQQLLLQYQSLKDLMTPMQFIDLMKTVEPFNQLDQLEELFAKECTNAVK